MKKSYLCFFLASLLYVFADQLIKYSLRIKFPLFITENRGVFFGLINNPWIIYPTMIVGFTLLTWIILSSQKISAHQQTAKWYYFSLSLIVAGATSNLLDRLFYGAVVDYIKLGFWPVFNLADIYLFVGVFIYAFNIFRDQQ